MFTDSISLEFRKSTPGKTHFFPTKHSISFGVALMDETDLNNLETATCRVGYPKLVSLLICLGLGSAKTLIWS